MCDRRRIKYCIGLVLTLVLILHLRLDYFCAETDCVIQNRLREDTHAPKLQSLAELSSSFSVSSSDVVARESLADPDRADSSSSYNYRSRLLQYKSNRSELGLLNLYNSRLASRHDSYDINRTSPPAMVQRFLPPRVRLAPCTVFTTATSSPYGPTSDVIDGSSSSGHVHGDPEVTYHPQTLHEQTWSRADDALLSHSFTPPMLIHGNMSTEPLDTSYVFDIDGDRDVFVFLHMQKTGGTTFGKHLIHDLPMTRPCLCHHGRNKCECKNTRDLVWLVSRYSTGWRCGLHADWTELTSCVDGMLDKLEGHKRGRRYLYVTFLRSPFSRYLSEYKHVSRGATWDSTKLQCDGRQATLQEVPPCFTGKNWKGVDLDSFTTCPYNLANNRQTRMLANLSVVGCYENFSRLDRRQQCAMLNSAKENLRQMAFFGLTEYQKESQWLFERTFGLEFMTDFFQYNHTHSSEVALSAPQRARLRSINDLDIQLYRFAKGLFFQRLRRLKNVEQQQRQQRQEQQTQQQKQQQQRQQKQGQQQQQTQQQQQQQHQQNLQQGIVLNDTLYYRP